MKALRRVLFVCLLLLAGFWSQVGPQPVTSDRRLSADEINRPLQRGKGVGHQASSDANLPDIAQFQTNRSDRFLVDLEFLSAGHPFKGSRALHPHLGAHVHWDNSTNA